MLEATVNKIGIADYGMNVWYGGNFDIEKRLIDLKSIGYDGIERLDEAVSADDAMFKASVFRKLGMDFATCRGPNNQASIRWTSAIGKDYLWLSVPGSNERDINKFYRQAEYFAEACSAWGVKAILHNHLGTVAERQGQVEAFLDNCPNCGLLLDTGHLCAAGGDCLHIVEKYFSRIVAVHVKDYILSNPDIGFDKWWERGRFCELGAGNIGMDNAAILKALKAKGYKGWIFVEHDCHLQDPIKDLAISREYLRNAGF